MRLSYLRLQYLPALLLPLALQAQTPTLPADTLTRALPAVTVVGYGQQLPLRRTAAGVAVLPAGAFQRFNESSPAQAVNTLPGVRLEERATGSYRVSIRGSALRSPFGVRNVKVYYFDIPFTEANGVTPLNLLDAAQLGQLEVLKGPAGSVYGAGTGGVLRLTNRQPPAGQAQAGVSYSVGSYGLRRLVATAEAAQANGDYWRTQYAHQQLTGYRQQSALRRDVLTLDGTLTPGARQTLHLHALYTDLDYQLPGGLTRAQAEADPRQARPGTATAPGTVAQQARYATQAGLLGFTHEYRFSERWRTTATLYGRASRVATPYLVDWQRDAALGGGGRLALGYRGRLAGRTLRAQAGGEFQASFTSSRSYLNVGGQPTTLRYDDELSTRTGFAFAQADYDLPAGLLLTAGLSYNRLRYELARVSSAASNPAGYVVTQDFEPQLLPRVALLKELTSQVSAYGSVSAGYSPPTEAELRPSDGTVNLALQAERGLSYELGTRGTLAGGWVTFDVALFDFALHQTIVSRTDAQGFQLYANAGDTRQRGVEVALSGWLWQPTAAKPGAAAVPEPATGLRLWISYAYNHFRFGQYESAVGVSYAGNVLTGTAPHTLSTGLDLTFGPGFYLRPTVSHQAAIALNDANTDYAGGYWGLGARGGWRHPLTGRLDAELYAGLDNATDRHYSLGNDLNAFGGRYFQPAPGRSYYAGAALGYRWH